MKMMYRECVIESTGNGWQWCHRDYDGAIDARGVNEDGKPLADNRRGHCSSLAMCMEEIDEVLS